MRVTRRGIALLLALPLGSCSLLGPVLDRKMAHAPHEACYRFSAAAGGEGAPPQCLSMLRRAADGGWRPFDGASISAGDELSAAMPAAPSCQGNFTHVVLSGSATGAGAMRIEVPDGMARGAVGRTYRWDGATGPRLWVLGNINRTLSVPGGLRIAVAPGAAGEVQLGEICFKAYRNLHDREPEPAQGAPQ